jgi:dTDP-4-dehydrorhamnose reductase
VKVLIIGASGMVGWGLFNRFRSDNIDVVGTFSTRGRPGLVCGGYDTDIDGYIKGSDYVVLCGAVTDINRCFKEQEYSQFINVHKTIYIIQRCKELGSIPVFISSDYVFDGVKGNYSESSVLSPINVYGRQKAAVEKYMQQHLEKYYIFRLSRTYSVSLEEHSLFSELYKQLANSGTILAATDQIFNFTNIEYVTKAISGSLGKIGFSYGLYNLAKQYCVSRYQIAVELARVFSFDQALVRPVLLNELSFSEPRSLNTTLNCDKIRGVTVASV